MFKAAFSGRSEAPGGSGSGRPSKDDLRRKKSSLARRSESVVSSSSRRDDDRNRQHRRRDRPSSLYDNASSASRYQDAASHISSGTSAYGTAPSSRVGESRPLTESALRMLPDDDDEWVDDDKAARSERKKENGDERKRKTNTRSEKERSRSNSRERRDKKRERRTVSSSEKTSEKDKERKVTKPASASESSRALPEMGSFSQFPGQYPVTGLQQQDVPTMSGALPGSAPQQQFPGQDYTRPQPAPPQLGITRADSWGAAAEYYLDEGQSVGFQPGNRPFTPNMLVNPDNHLVAASAEAAPAQDTGHGSAADFFSGKVSPVPYSPAPTTPAKPTKPGKMSSSSDGKPSKPHRTSSLGTAAAALAAAGGVALSNHRHSSSEQRPTSLSYQSQGSHTPKTNKQPRHNSEGGVYYPAPPPNNTYPLTLPSTNGYSPSTGTNRGKSAQQTTNSNIPLYAAGVAATAGLASHEYNQHNRYNSQSTSSYKIDAAGGSDGFGRGPPRPPLPAPGGYSRYPSGDRGMGMQQHHHHHEQKGPMTRLKDGFFNLISTPEDTAKMEMYTEYIGVCKHCFDPRTSAWDAPRVHHYHKRQDSFEDLRRRRSYEKMSRKGSNESLRRQDSARVNKDNRYYASESSRRKRESGGASALGAGLAAAGVAAGASALYNDRKNFDDTYSVKSGHRESSAVRRRSRSSSNERRRRSTYGVVRPDRDEYVTFRKDGRKVSQKARSSSRERISSHLGTAVAGAALGATALAATSRRRSRSRSRSRSPSVLNGTFGAPDSRSRHDRRPSPRSSRNKSSHSDREEESQGFFSSFFSPPQKKRRTSREHQKKRREFFTFSNSSSSSNSELAFGDAVSSKTNLPLRRKASTMSNRSGRRTSRRKSDEHIAATVAGLGATAAALAAAQKGHRVSKRTGRPELGKRRDVKHAEPQSDDDEWEDELPSDVDDESSVDGGLAFGDYGGRRLSSRQSLESVGSQSSAGGLSAWGWRWGGKNTKRTGRKSSASQKPDFETPSGSYAKPINDATRPYSTPVYLDDAGRPLPSIGSASTGSVSHGPMQHVDPRPISDAGSTFGSRHPSIPGAFEQEPTVIRPGPGTIQQPRPIAPSKPSFTQSPPEMEHVDVFRPSQPRRANSSPVRGHFAQDAALIGGAALATAGILAGTSIAGRRSREPSNVRFGLTEEQQRKEEREKDRLKRRQADRTRALKEEAERATKEAREEDARRAREKDDRKAAEARLAARREAEERARRETQERVEREQALDRERRERERLEREARDRRQAAAAEVERQRDQERARRERERLEQEARDRQEVATSAVAEVERHRIEREKAERQAGLRERERHEREEAAQEEDRRRRRDAGQDNRYVRGETERFERNGKSSDLEHSTPWGSIAAGATAAAALGAVVAGKQHGEPYDQKKAAGSSHDDVQSDRQSHRYGTDWNAEEKYAASREAEEQAELNRVASERYGRSKAGVEVKDGYVAAEIKPENEHEGEPLMDDEIYDPDYFNRRHTPAENARYAEFARRAAEKVVSADEVVSERQGAYNEQGTSYADFFAPKELLSKATEGKTRPVSPDTDNVVQVWRSQDAEIQSHFPTSDYGYGRSKNAPYGVPRLNVIAPTPPPGSGSKTSQRRRSRGSSPSSPLSKTQDVEPEPSAKSERSRSISWGEDKTHIYDVQTPDSYQDRDSYIVSPDARGSQVSATTVEIGEAAVGAGAYEITIEEPDGGRKTYSEDDWARQEKNHDAYKAADDDEDIEDITPEPETESHGFYRQPFFDSVSDVGASIFNVDSPGTEGAPLQRGFIEGETDEPTPEDEKAPHIPGGFDDEMDDIYRPTQHTNGHVVPKAEDKPATVTGAARNAYASEEPAWKAPMSKSDSKKREKAAKRAGSISESDPPTPAKETAPLPRSESPAELDEEPADYFPRTSKKTKRRDEGKQTSFADIATSVTSEPTKKQEDVLLPSVTETEPPLSKKKEKKRPKEAAKQGLADIADTVLAAGGIAAAAVALDSNEDSSSPSRKKNKKGKKPKLGEPMDRDPRDLEFATRLTELGNTEPKSMPGGWDNEREETQRQETQDDNVTVDPFQYQIPAETPPAASEPPTPQATDPWAEWLETPKKLKKKGKRGSAAFNVPDVSSPLRTEVAMNDYIGQGNIPESITNPVTTSYVNGDAKAPEASSRTQPGVLAEEETSQDRVRRDSEFFEEGSKVSESPRQLSPDDLRSVASAPTPDHERGRNPRQGDSRRGSDYFDEPSYAYETQSVAASEPADVYKSSKKSKRRSRHADDDDDTASVVSNRSRRGREKEESPSVKKDKKAGLFGLFSRKSGDDSKPSRDKDRSDGTSLSRESTRESRNSRNEEDDENRRRRKKKHRDSDYGNDDNDDDTRSMKSDSRRRHSVREDEEHGRSSPVRTDPADRHHRRRRTDEGREDLSRRDSREARRAGSESGHRHHERRRTDEEARGSSSKDQSFLGMRVGDLPPLPDSRPSSPDLASVKQQQGEGSPADTTSGTGLVRSEDELREEEPQIAEFKQEDQDRILETPRSSLETPDRPASLHRPVSATAVPLRFPFGTAPQTPGGLTERAQSFSSPVGAASTPASPAAGKQTRQGRPHSTEFRPLYLVERNRKTPEVEDTLPSLPSSKPSSRASSIHGSDDNYQSAVEELETHVPDRARKLTLDIGEATAYQPDDILDSQEATPRASEFSQSSLNKLTKQEPQFYTWEDFARDERLHEGDSLHIVSGPKEHGAEPDSQPPTRPRSKSPVKTTSALKSAAAAAMLGTAAVYAHKKLKDRSPERHSDTETESYNLNDGGHNAPSPYTFPLPAPLEDAQKERPKLSRKGSSKKKMDNKGKKQQMQDDELESVHVSSSESQQGRVDKFVLRGSDTFFDVEELAEAGEMGSEPVSGIVASAPAHLDRQGRRDTDLFLEHEAMAEEGVISKDMEDHTVSMFDEERTIEQPSALSGNDIDRFIHQEQVMEEGTAFPPSTAAHSILSHTWQKPGTDPETPVTATTSTAAHTIPVTTLPNFPTVYSPSTDKMPASRLLKEADDILPSERNVAEGTPFSPLPAAPRDDAVEKFLHIEKDLEEGSAFFPSIAAHSTPLHRMPEEPAPAELSLKESIYSEELEETGGSHVFDTQDASFATDTESSSKTPRADLASPAIEQRNVQINSDEHEQYLPDVEQYKASVPDAVGQSEQASEMLRGARESVAPIGFGVQDFSNLTHATSLSWQEAQSRAFTDSMLRSASLDDDTKAATTVSARDDDWDVHKTPVTEAGSQYPESPDGKLRPGDEQDVSFASEREAEKNQNQKQTAWSESDVDVDSELQKAAEELVTEDRDYKATAINVGLAAATGAAATALASEASHEPKPKKKAKKDKKKKKPSTWSEIESEVPSAREFEDLTDLSLESLAQSRTNGSEVLSDVGPDEELERSAELSESLQHRLIKQPQGEDSETLPATGPEETLNEAAHEEDKLEIPDDVSPVTATKTSKKDKKKNKKSSVSWADPIVEPEFESTSHRMSVEDKATIDAIEALSESRATGDVVSETYPELPVTPIAEADETSPIVPKKQSKKEKKKNKKKAQPWFEDDQDVEQTSSPRQMSIGDMALVDASESQPSTEEVEQSFQDGESVAEPVRMHTEPEPSIGGSETAELNQPLEYSAPVSTKKGKKDKSKKKLKQSFDWMEAESELAANEQQKVVETPLPSIETSEEVLGTQNADASNLVDSTESKVSQISNESLLPLEGQTKDDRHETPALDFDSTPQRITEQPQTSGASVLPVRGEQLRTQESAHLPEEAASTAFISDLAAEQDPSQPQGSGNDASEEFAPIDSKKQSKKNKKKNRQSGSELEQPLEETPQPESPEPESRDVLSILGEISNPTPETVPSEPVIEGILEENDERPDARDEAIPITDLDFTTEPQLEGSAQPSLSRKQSKKDKKKKRQQQTWVPEPASEEAHLPESSGVSPILEDSAADARELLGHASQSDPIELIPDDDLPDKVEKSEIFNSAPTEESQPGENFSTSLSKKQSKKDKKKKRHQQSEEPESESLVENWTEAARVQGPSQEESCSLDTQDMTMTPSPVAQDQDSEVTQRNLARKSSKKDKKKKKQQLQTWEPETVQEMPARLPSVELVTQEVPLAVQEVPSDALYPQDHSSREFMPSPENAPLPQEDEDDLCYRLVTPPEDVPLPPEDKEEFEYTTDRQDYGDTAQTVRGDHHEELPPPVETFVDAPVILTEQDNDTTLGSESFDDAMESFEPENFEHTSAINEQRDNPALEVVEDESKQESADVVTFTDGHDHESSPLFDDSVALAPEREIEAEVPQLKTVDPSATTGGDPNEPLLGAAEQEPAGEPAGVSAPPAGIDQDRTPSVVDSTCLTHQTEPTAKTLETIETPSELIDKYVDQIEDATAGSRADIELVPTLQEKISEDISWTTESKKKGKKGKKARKLETEVALDDTPPELSQDGEAQTASLPTEESRPHDTTLAGQENFGSTIASKKKGKAGKKSRQFIVEAGRNSELDDQVAEKPSVITEPSGSPLAAEMQDTKSAEALDVPDLDSVLEVQPTVAYADTDRSFLGTEQDRDDSIKETQDAQLELPAEQKLQPTVTEDQLEEFSWAPSSKKKGKRGKKARQSAVEGPPTPVESSTIQDFATNSDEVTEREQATDITQEDASEEHVPSIPQEGSAVGLERENTTETIDESNLAEQLLPISEETSIGEQQPGPTEATQDDFVRSFNSKKKKGKKGKKGQQSVPSTPLVQEEPITLSVTGENQPEVSKEETMLDTSWSVDDNATSMEDNRWSSSSNKKGKKDKKNRKSTFGPLPVVDEPTPVDESGPVSESDRIDGKAQIVESVVVDGSVPGAELLQGDIANSTDDGLLDNENSLSSNRSAVDDTTLGEPLFGLEKEIEATKTSLAQDYILEEAQDSTYLEDGSDPAAEPKNASNEQLSQETETKVSEDPSQASNGPLEPVQEEQENVWPITTSKRKKKNGKKTDERATQNITSEAPEVTGDIATTENDQAEYEMPSFGAPTLDVLDATDQAEKNQKTTENVTPMEVDQDEGDLPSTEAVPLHTPSTADLDISEHAGRDLEFIEQPALTSSMETDQDKPGLEVVPSNDPMTYVIETTRDAPQGPASTESTTGNELDQADSDIPSFDAAPTKGPNSDVLETSKAAEDEIQDIANSDALPAHSVSFDALETSAESWGGNEQTEDFGAKLPGASVVGSKPSDLQEHNVDTEPIPAASSSKKKGKKGKKSRASVVDIPVVDTTNSSENQPLNEEQRALSSPPAESLTPVEDQDSSRAPPSNLKKNKGKNDKTGVFGFATALAADAGTKTAESDAIENSPSEPVEQPPEATETPTYWAEVDETAEPEALHEEASEQTAVDSTFTDIWADEDLATQEDNDAVKDLVDDPSVPDSQPWGSSSSKKSKKKGKKTQVIELSPRDEPKANISEPGTHTTQPETQHILNTVEGNPVQSQQVTDYHINPQDEPRADSFDPQASTEKLVEAQNVDKEEIKKIATPFQQTGEEGRNWPVPTASNKKKGKKGKKSRQASAFEESDVTAANSAGDSQCQERIKSEPEPELPLSTSVQQEELRSAQPEGQESELQQPPADTSQQVILPSSPPEAEEPTDLFGEQQPTEVTISDPDAGATTPVTYSLDESNAGNELQTFAQDVTGFPDAGEATDIDNVDGNLSLEANDKGDESSGTTSAIKSLGLENTSEAQPSKKKGKKGRKNRQSTVDDVGPVIHSQELEQGEPVNSANNVEAPREDAFTESKKPSEGEASEAWAMPTKGKKGKNGKKNKQVLSWIDGPVTEPTQMEVDRSDDFESSNKYKPADEPYWPNADFQDHDNPEKAPEVDMTTQEISEKTEVLLENSSELQPEVNIVESADRSVNNSMMPDFVEVDESGPASFGETSQQDTVITTERAEIPVASMDPLSLEATERGQMAERNEPPTDNDKDFVSTVKRGKKGKKGRKSTSDAWIESLESPTIPEFTPAEQQGGQSSFSRTTAAITALAAGAALVESATAETEEDEWSGFSSQKSKKQKNKAKKGERTTLAHAQDNLDAAIELTERDNVDVLNEDILEKADEPSVHEVMGSDPRKENFVESGPSVTSRDVLATSTVSEQQAYDHDEEHESASTDIPTPSSANASGKAKLAIATGEPAQEQNVEGTARIPLPVETPGEDVALQESTGYAGMHDVEDSTVPARASSQPPQDIDFTATVAAGLADTGFDPNLVINDPVFQHRASPPGALAEADPGEVIASASNKRRKGKKAKQSRDISDSPSESRTSPDTSIVATSSTADDFNATLSQSLAGSGFDPALLDRALAAEAIQSSQDITDDPEGIPFTSSKPKKGKQGKQKKKKHEDSSAFQQALPSHDDAIVKQQDDLSQAQDATLPTTDHTEGHLPADNSADQIDDIDTKEYQSAEMKDREMATTAGDEAQEASGAPVNILTVGGHEMDMDEMDRQYKQYKKNKRQQKKTKSASRTAGFSSATHADSADISTAVSDDDPLSQNTTSSDTHSLQAIVDTQATASSDTYEESRPTDSMTVPSNSRSVVQSVFPGLERVKRRVPSKSEEPESEPSVSPSAKPVELLHTSDVSQLLPVAASRSPLLPESAKEPHNIAARSGSPSFKQSEHDASMASGIGATQALEGTREFLHGSPHDEPTWGFSSIDEDPKHLRSSTMRNDDQSIRDVDREEAEHSLPSAHGSSQEEPPILQTSSSRDSLRERRSLEPLHIPKSPQKEREPSQHSKKRSLQAGDHATETHSRTPSAGTPLRPTSKDRTSYLFQSPPDVLSAALANASRSSDQPTPPDQKSDDSDHIKKNSQPRDVNEDAMDMSRDYGQLVPSPTSGSPSPKLALDAIPEEHHAGKRSKAVSDVGGPEHIKIVKRAETPQSIRAREQALSPSVRPNMAVPNTNTRSTSDQLSTDDLINRLSWPSVDDQNDAVHIDQSLGHKHSKAALPDPRSPSVMSNRSNTSGTHFRSPQELRSYSRNSNHSRSSTPSLRRANLSGDLRAASRRGESGSAVGATASPKTIPFEAPPTPPLNDDDVAGSSLSCGVDMNDDVFVSDDIEPCLPSDPDRVQQGYGDAQGSQVSPTRPPSVRKRQSMHITELENKLDQLTAENRALQEARHDVEHGYHASGDSSTAHALQEALMARDVELQEKDAEISKIKAMLEPLHEEVARLTEINGGLTESNRNLVDDANGRYATLQAEHAHAHEQWQSANRELETMRSEHGRVTSGMKDLIEAEVATALADKNAEILRLREQLDVATEQIRALQVQIQSSKSADWLGERDEDYFDGACQKLCQHVQQWVLRFSKLSDNRVCRLSTELNDDRIETKLDNAILDASDVDKLLGDRVRRRDVFMSLVMTVMWEYVFTRYLFGMDREQRQKLKALEKTLAEVGPPRAVAHWRATTLTLLSKRPSFATQCTMDAEAVAHEIFRMLSSLLPPPPSAEQQLLTSLLRVINIAVNLSIEMRTQRAEYIMLPPLQPEYDTNGDLVQKFHFNALLMNERSGFFSSNEELEEERAVVKIVLFPLVVKKGDDVGEGEEETVVCPAQVLVQNEGNRGKKVVRVMSGAMEIDDPIRSRKSNRSLVSEAPGNVEF